MSAAAAARRSTRGPRGSGPSPLAAAPQSPATGKGRRVADDVTRSALRDGGRRQERTLNATSPTITPAAKNANAWMSQMTPHTVVRSGGVSAVQYLGVLGEGEARCRKTHLGTGSTRICPQTRTRQSRSPSVRLYRLWVRSTTLRCAHISSEKVDLTDNVPEDVHIGHNADEKDLGVDMRIGYKECRKRTHQVS